MQRPYLQGETIAALATPPGEGGIAIIRISGKEAIEIASRLFSGPVKKYLSHTAHTGYILDESGKKIDFALLLVMRAPKSYTGEDSVELHCHGGMIASKKVLEAVLKAGARMAAPGEFTFKAFMNGKLDLTQAEAVQELIGAKNEYAFQAATTQLEGSLSKKVSDFQQRAFSIAAILEAWVDFPEEGLEFASREELVDDLRSIQNEMEMLINSFENGKKLAQGITLCIAGAPNVGKSSLMNALLNEERAIVTSIAGTTRDLLHEEMVIDGFSFRLTDTAGIRETEGIIEKEGIRRSEKALQQADFILFVIDVTKKAPEILDRIPKEKTILIFNKVDLPHKKMEIDFPVQLELSAKKGEGIDHLRQTLVKMVWDRGAPSKEEVLLTSMRHKEALQEAHGHCKAVETGLLSELSPELITIDIRSALTALGRIIGKDVGDEILTAIFSKFCIGK